MTATSEIRSVLQAIPVHTAVYGLQEFVEFWIDVLDNLVEEDVKKGGLTLNRKVGRAKQAPWYKRIQGFDGDRFLVRSIYNDARDIVRAALEKAFPVEAAAGEFDHLELFVTEEVFPRLPGEEAKAARKRHLQAGIQRFWDQFARLAPITLVDFEQLLIGLPVEDLKILEMLFSNFKDEDLLAAKAAGAVWLKNHGCHINHRAAKIRLLRKVRHQSSKEED